jgi:hypothetical protein
LYPFIYLKGGDYVLPRLINENLLAIAMKYHCLTDGFRYVAAGRSELGRDDSKHEQLASEYMCTTETISQITRKFRENRDNFRKLAIEKTRQHYKVKGIQVSAGSVRAYLMRRRRKYGNFDFQSVEQSLKAHEERFEVALRKFEGVTLEYERLQNFISGGIRGIAKQDFQPTVEASKVASALQAMHDALDQLDPRPVDQIGTAPPDFHEIVSPVFKHREFWIPNSIWCNLNNGRHSR